MVKSKEEIIAAITAKIGTDASDDTVSIIEDVTDTLSYYETKLADPTDWKAKYEQNDADWRKKYIDRFSNPNVTTLEGAKESQKENVLDDGTPRSFDVLFKEREG